MSRIPPSFCSQWVNGQDHRVKNVKLFLRLLCFILFVSDISFRILWYGWSAWVVVYGSKVKIAGCRPFFLENCLSVILYIWYMYIMGLCFGFSGSNWHSWLFQKWRRSRFLWKKVKAVWWCFLKMFKSHAYSFMI